METNLDSITIATSVNSVTDGAYQQAKVKGVTESIVSGLMLLIPGLGVEAEPFSDDNRADLRAGYARRWDEINPTRYFMAVDGNWVEKPEAEVMKAKAEKFTLDVHTAFAYSQQAFGALKNEEPAKHALIKDVRDRFNKYVSNCLNDLKREASRIYKARNNIANTKNPVAAFYDWLMVGDKCQLTMIRQRAVNAQSRGDETVDLKKLDAAIVAFKAKIK